MARLLRQSANSLFSTFAAIYLYRSGYGLVEIALFYTVYSLGKFVIVLPISRVVAYIGPKHGMFWANLCMIPALLIFSMLPSLGAWAVVGFFLFQGISVVLYDLSHKVNFSKIKNAKYAGRELGVMNIIDKVAAGVSPVVGGLIAWYGGPQWTLWVAAFMLMCAAIPLFLTEEQITTKQKISFKKFPFKSTWRSVVAQAGVGVDVAATAVLWPLMLAMVVFMDKSGAHDSIYVKIGVLASIALVVGFVMSRVFGRLIDKNKGGLLLKYSVNANAVVHLLRLGVSTPMGIIMVNILNEAATVGQNMAFMRGIFDTADRSGYRISYLTLVEMSNYLGASLMYATTAGTAWLMGDSTGFMATFIFAAALMSLMRIANFPLYR